MDWLAELPLLKNQIKYNKDIQKMCIEYMKYKWFLWYAPGVEYMHSLGEF
jgi:hypothetical protein